jgi:prophage regulatory protein
MKAVRWPRVHELTGLSRPTVWRLETDGLFPKRRRLSGNMVAWIEDEIIEWLDSREVGMGQAPGERGFHPPISTCSASMCRVNRNDEPGKRGGAK